MWVQSLDGEDPLEEGLATHSSILVWRIPWTEEPGRLQSIGSQSLTQLKQLSMQYTFQYGMRKEFWSWMGVMTSQCEHVCKAPELYLKLV